MQYSEEQYERVAKYLDGENVELNVNELRLAGELNDGFTDLSKWINAQPKMKPRRRALPLRWVIPALAAAGVVLAVIIFTEKPGPQNINGPAVVQVEPDTVITETISDLRTISQQQDDIEVTSILLEQHNGSQDYLAEDMASNSDRWLEVLDNTQSRITPESVARA